MSELASVATCASKVQRLKMIRATIIDSIGTDVDLVEQVMEHSLAGGKGLRGLVAHISCDWCELPRETCNIIAGSIEMIHFASLLHDDVVDEAMLRRHKASANAIFGPSAAVLVGDFLYSRASQLLSQEGNLALLAAIADATNQLAQGEVMQLAGKGELASEDEYMQVITRKTASLFATSAMTGALTAECPEMLEPLREYGKNLGLSFQMMDDCLDYQDSSTQTGKDGGHDFSIGTSSLPLLRATKLANTKQKSLLKKAFANRTKKSAFAQVLEIIEQTETLESIMQDVEDHVAIAVRSLEVLPECPHQAMLRQIATATVKRRS